MDIKEVKRRVSEVEAIAIKGDDESAHAAEDSVHRDFIKHIADSANGETAIMAREVLRMDGFDIAHWYA